MIDRQEGGVQAEGEAPTIFLDNILFILFILTHIEGKIPRVGGAEKLKVQEAIPPFSLIEDSIQGRRAETLVKTA